MALDQLSGLFSPRVRICGRPLRLLSPILLLLLLQTTCAEATGIPAFDLTAVWPDAEDDDGENVARSDGPAPIAGGRADPVLVGSHEVGVVIQHEIVLVPKVSSLATRSLRGPPAREWRVVTNRTISLALISPRFAGGSCLPHKQKSQPGSTRAAGSPQAPSKRLHQEVTACLREGPLGCPMLLSPRRRAV